jgi:hypothetical protein
MAIGRLRSRFHGLLLIAVIPVFYGCDKEITSAPDEDVKPLTEIVTGATDSEGRFAFFSYFESDSVVVEVSDTSQSPLSQIQIDFYHTGTNVIVFARDPSAGYYPSVSAVSSSAGGQQTSSTVAFEAAVEPITITVVLAIITVLSVAHWLITSPPDIDIIFEDHRVQELCATGDLEDVVNTLLLVGQAAGSVLHIGRALSHGLNLSGDMAQLVNANFEMLLGSLIEAGFDTQAKYRICVYGFVELPGTYLPLVSIEGVGRWIELENQDTAHLNGLWGIDQDEIFASGTGGTILQYDGTQWKRMQTGTSVNFDVLWGTSSNDIFVVGNSGKILHYDGTEWKPMNSKVTSNLDVVWGVASNRVFAAGAGGTILEYDGHEWTQSPNITSSDIRGMWGPSVNNIYAVGDEGVVLQYNGSDWNPRPTITGVDFTDLWGTSAENIVAVGLAGKIYKHATSEWVEMTSPTSENLYGVWGWQADDEIYAVGMSGTILKYNGIEWSEEASPVGNWLIDIWGSPDGTVFSVGTNGTVLRYNILE